MASKFFNKYQADFIKKIVCFYTMLVRKSVNIYIKVFWKLVIYSESLPLSYRSNESYTKGLNFVAQYGNNIIPIEVNANTNLQSKSLKSFIKNTTRTKHYAFQHLYLRQMISL